VLCRVFGKILVFIFSFFWVTSSLSAEFENGRVTIGLARLMDLNSDRERMHQGIPLGVPKSYDWAKGPRIGAGNNQGAYRAVTGWGQVFWNEGASGHSGMLQIRNFQTFLCHGKNRSWELVQEGGIQGREFRADFANNTNKEALVLEMNDGVASVKFSYGLAFHFWLEKGRAKLPESGICGFVVLLEARLTSLENLAQSIDWASPLLIGLGADYWVDTTSRWDNYKTNTDIAIGRLKSVGPNWTWYGISTASDSDLKRLYGLGYRTISANEKFRSDK